MRQYKKDKETGRMMVRHRILDEWEDLENHIEIMRKESKKKSKTWKDKLKSKAIKKIKEI